jgi:DNA (cytosine-5)-methyltransferase 1
VFSFYEFFAGGGMVRAGLGARWMCAFANDFDLLKANTYKKNFGADNFVFGDIHQLDVTDLGGKVDLAWASFPCQDLSCAGSGLGIGEEGGRLRTRSGTFWPFVALMRALKGKKRAPKLIILENVLGLLRTNDGADFRAVASALADLGYRVGAVVVDARHFVPQSRPRLFFIGIAERIVVPSYLETHQPLPPWHPDTLVRAWSDLPRRTIRKWIWWNPGNPPAARENLADIVSDAPIDAQWHTKAQTKRLISLMSPIHRRKLSRARRAHVRMIATLFLRMRPDNGANRQRAEISFGDVCGCIRTPKGGGSRLRVLMVKGPECRSRVLSPREAAALMGLNKSYKLPSAYESAFRVIGDGVAIPVVRFLRDKIIEPLLEESDRIYRPRKRRRQRRTLLGIAASRIRSMKRRRSRSSDSSLD